VSALDAHRDRLDGLDAELLEILGERFQTCRQVARFKSANEVPMMQPERVEIVRARYRALGTAAQLPSEFTDALFELIIAATCAMEDELMAASGSEVEPR
jgi:4-amino-4-deoxychorismate mutase